MDGLDRMAEVVARLRRALRRGARASQQDEPFSVAQFELLQFLADDPGVRAGELAQGLRMAPTTVSTLLGAMLDARAVNRQADPHDRRAYRLYVTAAGQRRLDTWQGGHARLLAAAMAHLSSTDRLALERALPALERLTDELIRATDG